MSLSVVIIAQDEEANIAGCLASLPADAAEVVLVDGGSRDRTLERAAEAVGHGTRLRILHRPFDSAARQMNLGIAHAQGDWVLLVDCDERLSSEMRQAVATCARAPERLAGFYFPRRNYVFGRWLRHGGNYPDCGTVRLFRRGQGWFEDQPVHARLQVTGDTAFVDAPLLHFCYPDLGSYFRKFNRYTSAEAERMAASGQRFSWTRMAAVTGCHLLRRGLLQRAYRDGAPGLIYLGLGGVYDLVRFLKLRERQRPSSRERRARACESVLTCKAPAGR